MAALTDDRWGIAKESVYGTGVTVTRFYPWVEAEGEWDNRRRTAMGLQGGGGRRTVLGNRSFLPVGQGKVKTKVELDTKGLGVLLDLGIGVSTVTAITGGSQQVFHPGLSSGFLPSCTIQMVKVMNPGTESVETFTGCTASKVVFEQGEEEIPTCEIEWDARTVTTATAAATPAYPSNPTMFDASQGVVTMGGAVAAPSASALGSVATAFGDFKKWKLEVDQNLDTERWVIGGRNQPIAGVPKYKFDGEAEFNSAVVRDYVLNGSRFGWQQTWTTTEVLGAGFAQLQILVPQMGLTGDLAKVKSGETRTIGVKGEIVNDGTLRDMYVAYRTSDVAL